MSVHVSPWQVYSPDRLRCVAAAYPSSLPLDSALGAVLTADASQVGRRRRNERGGCRRWNERPTPDAAIFRPPRTPWEGASVVLLPLHSCSRNISRNETLRNLWHREHTSLHSGYPCQGAIARSSGLGHTARARKPGHN